MKTIDLTPIIGKIAFMSNGYEDDIRFNNDVTKRTLRSIVKNGRVLFINAKTLSEALSLKSKIFRYGIRDVKYHVSIWCIPTSKKNFKKIILESMRNGNRIYED
jgi:hypothetical protein